MSVGKPVEIGRHPPSFMHTHSHLYCTRGTKKEGQRRRRTSVFDVWLLCLGFGLSLNETFFFGHCIMVIYIKDVFVGFFPLGFPRVNCCVPFDFVSFNDPLYVFIVKLY